VILRAGLLRLAGLLPLLLTNGCSADRIVDSLTPHEGYRLIADRPYGEGPRRKLDVYLPDPPVDHAPMVVFFYGGNWQSGDKAMYRFIGQALASRGVVTVIPDYRLYPEARYADFLADAAAAVAWSGGHAAELGGDPARLYLMGHSAGAYIAAMLALDRRWLGARPKIAGMIGLSGPYDFLPLTDPMLQRIFAPENEWPATQPIFYARGDAPPLLLLTGDDDDTVDPGNTARLASRIRALGGDVTEKHYPGVGHLQIIGAMAAPFHFIAPTLDDAMGFVEKSH
jgi:acetyl esterase/lipase